MSDNIVKFPKRELDIDVELDETEQEYDEMVSAINTMLEMQMAGLIVTSEAKWHHIMDACLSMAVSAGLRSGLDTEEIEEIMHSASIQEVKYDA